MKIKKDLNRIGEDIGGKELVILDEKERLEKI